MNYPTKAACEAALEMAKRTNMEVAIMCFTDMLAMHDKIDKLENDLYNSRYPEG
jgi:hypothetical protein